MLLSVFLLFGLVLPWLANLTPPGVDPKMVAALAAQPQVKPPQGANDPCRGMACPAGWTTALSPETAGKCICKRLDPTNEDTPWDAQQKEQKRQQMMLQAAADAQAQATDPREVMASMAAAAAGAAAGDAATVGAGDDAAATAAGTDGADAGTAQPPTGGDEVEVEVEG